jgi:hypothetical protein
MTRSFLWPPIRGGSSAGISPILSFLLAALTDSSGSQLIVVLKSFSAAE